MISHKLLCEGDLINGIVIGHEPWDEIRTGRKGIVVLILIILNLVVSIDGGDIHFSFRQSTHILIVHRVFQRLLVMLPWMATFTIGQLFFRYLVEIGIVLLFLLLLFLLLLFSSLIITVFE